jgi:hypothetical protein
MRGLILTLIPASVLISNFKSQIHPPSRHNAPAIQVSRSQHDPPFNYKISAPDLCIALTHCPPTPYDPQIYLTFPLDTLTYT